MKLKINDIVFGLYPRNFNNQAIGRPVFPVTKYVVRAIGGINNDRALAENITPLHGHDWHGERLDFYVNYPPCLSRYDKKEFRVSEKYF